MDDRQPVRYLVFDIETIADGSLIQRVKYPHEELTPQQATRRFRDETLRDRGDGKDILPTSYMLPAAVVVAKIDARYRLLDLTALDAPQYRPHVMTRLFWQGWSHYQQPTLVSFNGRGYDLPILEQAAFRYGLPLSAWFNVEDKSFEQARNRYNLSSHLDLHDLLSNFGTSRIVGGLNLLANLLGKPGKTNLDGSKVQDLWDAGEKQMVNDYCRCDVLDTYFVFLRSRVLLGKLRLEEEHAIVSETKAWLEARVEAIPAYGEYLSHWGDWSPPVD